MSDARGSSRAVITGLGVVAPNGLTTEEYWAAALAGRSAIRRVSRFDPSSYSAQLAGQTDLDTARLPNRLLPQTDLMTRLALVAAENALADAGCEPRELPRYDVGMVTAASAGGFDFGQRELEALWSRGGEYVSAYQSFAWFYPVNSGQISIRHDLRGPGGALVADQAGGLDAMAKARRHLREGTAVMVTGAVDGSLSPWAWLCLIRSGRLSTATDPARAYLPFDAAARGYVPGEGGAIIVLEDERKAAERGAPRRYGELAGYASTFDGAPGTTAAPGLRRAIDLALADAGIEPAGVGVVFADAAGVPEADEAEARILADVFGPRGVPVTAPKTMTGRLLAGAGPLDCATALLALRDGVLPPTVHIERPAYEPLIDLVLGRPRPLRFDTALVLARGHGGFNSALVLRAV